MQISVKTPSKLVGHTAIAKSTSGEAIAGAKVAVAQATMTSKSSSITSPPAGAIANKAGTIASKVGTKAQASNAVADAAKAIAGTITAAGLLISSLLSLSRCLLLCFSGLALLILVASDTIASTTKAMA